MTPALARIVPSVRFARWPAIVVDPMSMATPNARSWKPGQTAMTSRPPWTATVTRYSPLVSAGWSARIDGEVGAQVVRGPTRSRERVEQAAQVAGRRGEIGRHDVHRVQADDRVQHERARVEVLAHDLAMDLALGRDVDDGVAEERARCTTSRRSGASPCSAR